MCFHKPACKFIFIVKPLQAIVLNTILKIICLCLPNYGIANYTVLLRYGDANTIVIHSLDKLKKVLPIYRTMDKLLFQSVRKTLKRRYILADRATRRLHGDAPLIAHNFQDPMRARVLLLRDMKANICWSITRSSPLERQYKICVNKEHYHLATTLSAVTQSG